MRRGVIERAVVLSVSLAAVCASAACRGEERGVSGTPYVCDCQRSDQLDTRELVISVCAERVGEAMDESEACAADHGHEVSFCDCAEDTLTFCEPGECSLD